MFRSVNLRKSSDKSLVGLQRLLLLRNLIHHSKKINSCSTIYSNLYIFTISHPRYSSSSSNLLRPMSANVYIQNDTKLYIAHRVSIFLSRLQTCTSKISYIRKSITEYSP